MMDRIEHMDVEDARRMAASNARRCKADDRAYDQLCKRMDAAYPLIGELCREGRTVHYINLRRRDGTPTGKTKEGNRHDLMAYLLRNNYV